MKNMVYGGIRLDEQTDGYIIDCAYAYPKDIMQLFSRRIYRTNFKSSVYWFGHEFKESVPSEERTKFIHYLKGIGEKKMPREDVRQFIELPLNELHRQINMYSIDCFVYPVSERSEIVQRMIEAIDDYISADVRGASFELVKSAPVDVEFDWERFEREVPPGTERHEQMSAYVKDTLMPAIKELDYFSLAANVKPKYRRNIKNFLNFSEEDAERLSRLKGKKILIVDDINTSGATLNEIIRIIQKINSECEIFIYTLIRNH